MKKIISAVLLGAMLTACSPATPAGPQTKEVTVKGMFDGLKVKVTATADKIEKVEVVANNETPEVAGEALKSIPAKIMETNKITVDAVSGATMTSTGIKTAVEQALTEMKLDVTKFK